MTRRRLVVGCGAHPYCLCLPKETLVRQVAKAAFDAGTDGELSGMAAETARNVLFFVPKVAAAD